MSTMAQVIAGLLLTAAILGALAGIGKAVLYVFNVLRRFNRWLDDWEGEPPRPGFPAGRPGVLDRIALIESRVERMPAVEERLERLEAQMMPNGGGSLRDAVDRTAAAVTAGAGDRSYPPDGGDERSAIVQP